MNNIGSHIQKPSHNYHNTWHGKGYFFKRIEVGDYLGHVEGGAMNMRTERYEYHQMDGTQC